MRLHKARTSMPLTKASLAYMNKVEDFIWFKVAPKVMVKSKSGKIYDYGKDALRIVDTAKATNGRYNKMNLTVSKTDHFYLNKYGLTGDVLEDDVEEAEAPINAEQDTSEVILHKLLLDGEKKIADSLRSTSVITQNVTLTGTSKWSDYTNGVSDPVDDIRTAVDTVRAATGLVPNTLILGYAAMETLKFHPNMKAYFPGAAQITGDMLKSAIGRLFNIKNLIVGSAVYTDTNLGAADEALTDVWGDDVIVAYIEQKPKLKSQTLCATYMRKTAVQTLKLGAKDIGERAATEEVYSMIIQKTEYDQVVVNKNCGYLIKDCV